MPNDDVWFVRSRIGYSFWPVRWPGWLLLAGYVLVMHLLALWPPGLTASRIAVVMVITVALAVIAARTSRRAWKDMT